MNDSFYIRTGFDESKNAQGFNCAPSDNTIAVDHVLEVQHAVCYSLFPVCNAADVQAVRHYFVFLAPASPCKLTRAFNSVRTSPLCSSWHASLHFSAELSCSNRVLKAGLKFLMKFLNGSDGAFCVIFTELCVFVGKVTGVSSRIESGAC